ncbi:hypothetical protein, partial [Citrobacter freundii]|uniref:hypothetical protein n=1 Tax=Citrobacter freundii TaxID=546 RepID=UPI00397A6182
EWNHSSSESGVWNRYSRLGLTGEFCHASRRWDRGPSYSGVWNQYSGMGYRLSSDMQAEG